VKRLFVAAGIAAILLVACGGTNRPEGVVERWLVSLNQGKAGEPQKYAVPAVTDTVLPNWKACDPGSLDVIEVGQHGAGPNGSALVPYRIKYVTDLSSCNTNQQPTAPLKGAALVRMEGGDWRVTALQTRSASSPLKVPSEGGEPIGNAPLSTWLIALAISAVLMLIVAVIIRLQPEPAPLPKEAQTPS
jgi:hypothetical protein